MSDSVADMNVAIVLYWALAFGFRLILDFILNR